MKRLAAISTAIAAFAAIRTVWRRKVTRVTAEARRDTRRQLVAHLRANPRGLTILDNVSVNNSSIVSPDPITILGEYAMITCNFIASNQSEAAI